MKQIILFTTFFALSGILAGCGPAKPATKPSVVATKTPKTVKTSSSVATHTIVRSVDIDNDLKMFGALSDGAITEGAVYNLSASEFFNNVEAHSPNADYANAIVVDLTGKADHRNTKKDLSQLIGESIGLFSLGTKESHFILTLSMKVLTPTDKQFQFDCQSDGKIVQKGLKREGYNKSRRDIINSCFGKMFAQMSASSDFKQAIGK